MDLSSAASGFLGIEIAAPRLKIQHIALFEFFRERGPLQNGDVAVLERTALPKKLKEGDVLDFEAGSCYLNAEETARRRRKIQEMMASLLEEQ